ncbi:uncharacterized protein LOC122870153 isoform X3 [Siniperca chuatsi]|uniref:uncharacterized protein LOC122870153 isoform X3 n=1 Tax=Siniperca chuatsi TaxID=119488 RepID=UPI001CE0FA19|nr:uncharacterized protein LOC122870153 isoform X3 [Siniperca chuatsi]
MSVILKMVPPGFTFLCCCLVAFFSSVTPPASGLPLHTSPGRVSAAAGKDAVLPCRLATSVDPFRVMAVEWSRVDGPSPLIVHVLRNGEELVKEKALQYLRRTAIMEDGSLKLLGVQRRDSGTYRCVLLRGSSVEDEVLVSLIVAQVSEVNMSVRRTPANELLVYCESSGWSPEPLISLLDASGDVLAAETASAVRPDGLHSVRALANVAAAKAALTGNGTLICRVEIPGMSLASENKIYVTDEFDPPEAGLGCYFVLVVAVALVCVVVFVVPVPTIEKLRSLLHRLTVFCVRLIAQQSDGEQEQLLLGEYGDFTKVDTKGASDDTARANNLLSGGIVASNELAERDLKEMLKYKENLVSVGEALCVHPALIAGIISRQSQAGTKLSANGYGKSDPNCFGLMQISKYYHAIKGDPFSKDHVDQGVTFLIQLVKTMRRTKRDWTKEQQLKGALACYIAGEDKVIPLEYDEVDSVTPHKDFASDVVARAKWFARNGF